MTNKRTDMIVTVTGGKYCPICGRDGGLFKYPANFFKQEEGAFYLCENCNTKFNDMQTREEKELLLTYLGYVRFHSASHGEYSAWYRKDDPDCRHDPARYLGSHGIGDGALDKLWSYDDFLMPIVEMIEKGDFGFKMCRKRVEVYVDSTKETLISVKEDCRVNSLFKAIIEFVKLQNSKNQNT